MMQMRWIAILPILLAAGCSDEPAPPQPGSKVSAPDQAPQDATRYTPLEGCDLLRSAPEEAGFYEYECRGEGGYRLRLVQADLREDIVVISPDGAEQSLHLPALADGAFSSMGEKAEWRGVTANGQFTPDALVLRQSVMEDAGGDVQAMSYLLAVRLAGLPCVVARIPPQDDQNEAASKAADAGGECLPVPGE